MERSLTFRAWAGAVNLLAMLSAAMFLPAGTVAYWQAWMFLALFFLPVILITRHFLSADPALIERRLHVGPVHETRPLQKFLQTAASLGFLLLFIIPGFDHRYGWSDVPPLLSVVCGTVIAAGLFLIWEVFRVNSFTSALIEVSEMQTVISSGPYAVVRHPMYAGALPVLILTPIALGSWTGVLVSPLMLAVIVGRILDEERMLTEELEGYRDYRTKVRYRLVPYVW